MSIGSGRRATGRCSGARTLRWWAEIRRWRGFRWPTAIRRQGFGCNGHVSADTVRGRLETGEAEDAEKKELRGFCAGDDDAIRVVFVVRQSFEFNGERKRRIAKRQNRKGQDGSRTLSFFRWLRINPKLGAKRRSRPSRRFVALSARKRWFPLGFSGVTRFCDLCVALCRKVEQIQRGKPPLASPQDG